MPAGSGRAVARALSAAPPATPTPIDGSCCALRERDRFAVERCVVTCTTEDEQIAMTAHSVASSFWDALFICSFWLPGRVDGDDVLPVLQPVLLAGADERTELGTCLAGECEYEEAAGFQFGAELGAPVGEALGVGVVERDDCEVGAFVRPQGDDRLAGTVSFRACASAVCERQGAAAEPPRLRGSGVRAASGKDQLTRVAVVGDHLSRELAGERAGACVLEAPDGERRRSPCARRLRVTCLCAGDDSQPARVCTGGL